MLPSVKDAQQLPQRAFSFSMRTTRSRCIRKFATVATSKPDCIRQIPRSAKFSRSLPSSSALPMEIEITQRIGHVLIQKFEENSDGESRAVKNVRQS